MKSVEYEVVWTWRHEDHRKADVVEATNATRAISKLEKNLHDEYSFKGQELVILAVAPKGDWPDE